MGSGSGRRRVAAGAVPVERTLRPVRLVQDLPELGLSAGLTMEADGAWR